MARIKINVLRSAAWMSAVLAVTASASASGQTALPETVLSALSSSKRLQTTSSSTVVNLAIGLQPRFPQEFQAFCDSVSNPSSPNYRNFLTPELVGENFGASASDVQNVVAFLKSQGMTVDLVAKNRMSILVTATVGQVERAFSTQVNDYRGLDNTGVMTSFHANATPLMVPNNISNVVGCVVGVSSWGHPVSRTTLTPTMARTLYNTAPSYALGIQGQGRKVGFSNWDGYKISNAALFISNYGLPIPAGGSTSNIHVVSVIGSNNNTQGGGEGDLDLQMELSAAPLSDIYIYDSTNGQNLLSTLTKEANDNIADVLSESYGWPTGLVGVNVGNSCHAEHMTMTADGQTYLCASGDSGTSDMTNDPYPDIDPDITNVGGTVATTDGSGNRSSEVSWAGSGGGWTTFGFTFNTLPSWQVGPGVPTGNNHRLVPDIAAHSQSGNNAAFFIYYQGQLVTIAGTSCASPWCASGLTTVEQRLAALNLSSVSGHPGRLGRINDMIYAQNASATNQSPAWFDIVSGPSNGRLPDGTNGVVTAHWDFVTGWGAPNFGNLYTVIATRPVQGTVTLQNYSPSPAGVPITVQLYAAGTSNLVDTETTTLAADGTFTVNSQAPGGSYDIYVKASHWLRKKVTGLNFGLAGVGGLTYSLTNGDVNGDNNITLGDLSSLQAAYGSNSSSNNWNPNADLDGSGNVGLSDLGILRSNFGKSGD